MSDSNMLLSLEAVDYFADGNPHKKTCYNCEYACHKRYTWCMNPNVFEAYEKMLNLTGDSPKYKDKVRVNLWSKCKYQANSQFAHRYNLPLF